MPYVIKDKTKHEGILDEENQRAKCKCGYKSMIRPFPYQAKEDLFRHFMKAGTLKELATYERAHYLGR